MKLSDYLKDQIIAIMVMIATVALIVTILYVFNCSFFLVVYLAMLLTGAFLIILIYNFYRKKNYYDQFIAILNGLDEKYLITELIKKPNFLEAQILIDSIYEIDKSMKEHLNEAIERQCEFKEYIEMWCHEVKTPVATSQLIIENNSNLVTASIKEELVRIDDYVEQVLFYARSENVEKDYLVKDINLSDVVNAVIKRNKKDLINNRVKIELEDIDIMVSSDKKWLEFILHQIITNSIKYISDTPKIKIWSQRKKNQIELNIFDNGIGILKSEIDRVFDKGFTGTNGRTLQKSTGIGLYLCKKLCLRLNHEITISSDDQGTTVTIVFPYSSHIALK